MGVNETAHHSAQHFGPIKNSRFYVALPSESNKSDILFRTLDKTAGCGFLTKCTHTHDISSTHNNTVKNIKMRCLKNTNLLTQKFIFLGEKFFR